MEIEKKISTSQSQIRSHVAFTKLLLRTLSPGSVDAKKGRQRNIEKVLKSTLERWKPLATLFCLRDIERHLRKRSWEFTYSLRFLSDIDFCLLQSWAFALQETSISSRRTKKFQIFLANKRKQVQIKSWLKIEESFLLKCSQLISW